MGHKLLVNVFWGEHRISELLAMNVKEVLENDSDIIRAKIPFIEYTHFENNDYIHSLESLNEFIKSGKTEEDYRKFEREFVRPKLEAYDLELRNKFGPASFNLHDGVKIKGYNTPDIEFRIPNYIKEDIFLSDNLISIGKRHNLDIETKTYRYVPEGKLKFASPNSIIVELFQPHPEETMHYSSKRIEDLAKLFIPVAQGTWYHEQVAKTTHPIFIETVKKYFSYLKDVLLETNNLGLTYYDGSLPRMK